MPKRAVLLVSKEAHCLHDLLGRVAAGELPVRLDAVIGNHDTLGGDRARARRAVPPRAVPGRPARAARPPAFAELRELVEEHEPDAVVLARFMQILPPRAVRPGPGGR